MSKALLGHSASNSHGRELSAECLMSRQVFGQTELIGALREREKPIAHQKLQKLR